ncbi:phenylacetic acid degradation protein PaaN [Sphingobacteriales bacterium UPWRP_1]|nr:phenylacetic acid degradation protein PaaN [Sphingobacteriales bacterium TSM_CSS]PSJ72253.1 phenylacetic acid degradation protein PaaN [Sphingobacteriales bacterium UPWRP_1]
MSSLFQQHHDALNKAIEALRQRTFYAHYPEHPKAYGPDAPAQGQQAFENQLNHPFTQLLQTGATAQAGEEESPYWGTSLGISYPITPVNTLVSNAKTALAAWRKAGVKERTGILIESLERVKNRFFEIAWATQHTTGQSFIMSFQASGPHAADRAMETIALGYTELTRFPHSLRWEKPAGGGAFITLDKTFTPVPKGVAMVIGCSTFPTWNTVPGLYASLITGNTAIVKPHPKAILPIAIFVAELQQVLHENGFDPNTVQLAPDTGQHLITKELAEHPDMKIIDYTGSSIFGNYIETLQSKGKTVFTEKAGVNSVIIDSVLDLRQVMRNLAFSVSLYSGQMCTAPQNIFIPETGVPSADGLIPYETVVDVLKNEVASLALNPKMGAGTLGAIQNPTTLERAQSAGKIGGTVLLESPPVKNPEFENARICAPTIIEVAAKDADLYEREFFGPIVLVIKTENTQQSLKLAQNMALHHGAITCGVYCTNEELAQHITDEMNSVFVPVSLNFTGFIWVNQHAAFSDFHVTGGNPAGNASFTDALFINKRFVWVGNRINM